MYQEDGRHKPKSSPGLDMAQAPTDVTRGEGDGDIAGGVRDGVTARSGAPANVSGISSWQRT
jgi:hypothetical protein